jgi:hypothetical protein
MVFSFRMALASTRDEAAAGNDRLPGDFADLCLRKGA